MNHNKLEGVSPTEIGLIKKLTFCNLGNNAIQGGNHEVGNMTSLKLFWVSWNELDGKIRKEVGNLSNLLQLNVNGNALSGWIPEELCKLKSLMVLELWSNHLTGAIPTGLAHLPKLKQINDD